MTNAIIQGKSLIIPPRTEGRSITMYRTPSTVVMSPPPDVSTAEQMTIVEASGTLGFWSDPLEDRYSHDDGKPV
jgi:hypothetical protein